MVWNWQQPDWPRFQWDRARLEAAEKLFLVSGGVFVGTVRHLVKEELDQFTIEAMSTEAVTTSEIEGEILDRASVQSSLRKQLGLATDERRIRPAERGIAEMMVDLYRSFAEPLSEEMLFRWHRMVMSGSRNLRDVGRYRTGADAMQVVSGAIGEPRVHFEAPPSARVPSEMKRFISWFGRSAPGGEEPLTTLTRAELLTCILRASIRLRTATGVSGVRSRRRPLRKPSASRRSRRWLQRFLRGTRVITKRSKPRTRKIRSRGG